MLIIAEIKSNYVKILTMNKMDKVILALPASRIKGITNYAMNNGGFKPFSKDNKLEYRQLLELSVSKRRGDLEEDSNYKQIIPYLVIKNQDKIFYYVRSNTADTRLVNKVSIGVGGHVDIEDTEMAEKAIDSTLEREAKEELGEKVNIIDIEPLGFIYTEQSEVDTVHLGLLFTAKISDPSLIEVNKEMAENGFVTAEELEKIIESEKYTTENWSKIAWEAICK